MIAKTNNTAAADAKAASVQPTESLASDQNKNIIKPVTINAKSA